ncbi:MAG: Crp/Fnr family transcriptional regulator [Myxococcota bacterium]
MSSPARIDRRSLLSRIAVFSALEPEELDLLSDVTITRRLKARDELFHKGDPGDEAYAIASGRLKATAQSADGREVTFSIMAEGEVFGDVAMLSGGRRTATVTALEASELLVIRRRDLIPLFERRPRIAIAAMASLAERLAHVSEVVEETLFLSLTARLARRLLSLADEWGERESGGLLRIDLKLSQSELGNLVGATREAVNKQMRSWEKSGLVTNDNGRLCILDREGLAALAAFPIP